TGDPGGIAGRDPRIRVVQGGDSRFGSVANAFGRAESPATVIAVHDAARPFPPRAVIDACIRLAASGCGAVAGIGAVDTVKRTDADGRIVETPARDALWYAQTPQVFPRELFARGVAHCRAAGIAPTDDAAMVEQLGEEVRMVPSSATNLKITRPEDLVVAEGYLEQGLV
ncbi:MAG: 2-C-methyl-D-erythritol 4-phosphate cytidylyltransferase, partial [Gemmatimonadetes bacterium]|nr:2-C-methyl-D-erythritol 4-phosphate cytidylyltransferase [Gemmatimonadota bacterium]